MKYFKNANNQIFAYDDEQVKQGYGKDLTPLESGEFYDGVSTQIKPYKLEATWEAIARETEGNIISPQGLVDQLQAEQAKALQDSYTSAMEAHMDAKAQEKNYDNRYTASARAGIDGSPFQAEGQAYAVWMDNCYAYGYQVLADVEAGTRELPTIDDFVAELPELVW